MPPEKRIAVAGGVAEHIFASPTYQRFVHANSMRVQFFPNIGDERLAVLKQGAHCFLLPILEGGGSNLKTAEALVSGAWVVATPKAMRGFEDFLDEPGLLLAESPAEFRTALQRALSCERLKLSAKATTKRDTLLWPAILKESEVTSLLRAMVSQPCAT